MAKNPSRTVRRAPPATRPPPAARRRFFDHKTAKLTLWHNGTDAPPTDGGVAVTQLAVLVNHTGTQAAPVKGMSWLGVAFADSAPNYMAPHGTPTGGDWAVSRAGALYFEVQCRCSDGAVTV